MSHNLDENIKPLLHFSEHLERATLIDDREDSAVTTKKRKSGNKKSLRKGKKVLRVTDGKFSIRVPGYSGGQQFSASQILPLIPVSKVRAAAKRVLSKSGKKKTRKARRRRKKKG